MIFLSLLLQIIGYFSDFVVLRQTGVIPDIRLHFENIDNTHEGILKSNWNSHDKWHGTKDVLRLLNHAIEISSDTVELVDENNTGNLGIVGVAPVGLGLGLNATGSAENTNTTVENLQRTIDLNREVNVSRSINDIHAMVIPETSGGSRLNGNSTFCLLLHEVGCGLTVVNLTCFVDLSGELKNTLGRRGFSCIHVREDADITVFAEVCHGNCLGKRG